MAMRILLAGFLGAVAMFFWAFIAHMVLPLGEAGTSELPNEKAVLASLQDNLGDQRGFYIFPGSGLGPDATTAEKRAAMEESVKTFHTKPSGVLVYRPPGRHFDFAKCLSVEFLLELIEALIAVTLLAQTRIHTFIGRVLFVTSIGVVAAITTNLSYWNWYGFPKLYTLSYMTTQAVGFVCAGLVAALILRKTTFR